jgi:hypothetical protein
LPRDQRARRREGHPTWSWTSLVGQIDYSLAARPLEAEATFFMENPDQSLVNIGDILHSAKQGKEKSIPERSRYLRIKGYVIKVRLSVHWNPENLLHIRSVKQICL